MSTGVRWVRLDSESSGVPSLKFRAFHSLSLIGRGWG